MFKKIVILGLAMSSLFAANVSAERYKVCSHISQSGETECSAFKASKSRIQNHYRTSSDFNMDGINADFAHAESLLKVNPLDPEAKTMYYGLLNAFAGQYIYPEVEDVVEQVSARARVGIVRIGSAYKDQSRELFRNMKMREGQKIGNLAGSILTKHGRKLDRYFRGDGQSDVELKAKYDAYRANIKDLK